MEKGLQRLYSLGGQLNLEKRHIAQRKVTFLGHVISVQGIEVDPAKLDALVALPPPATTKKLGEIFGLFYSCFSTIGVFIVHADNFEWTSVHQSDFEEANKVLYTLLVIKPPCWDETFYVCPSVGTEAMGAVLMQKDQENSFMWPIYFSSKIMGKPEKGYTDVEQMMFALSFAVRKFRPYLLIGLFVMLTVLNNIFHLLLNICTFPLGYLNGWSNYKSLIH